MHVARPPGRVRNKMSIHDDAPSCEQPYQPREDGFSWSGHLLAAFPKWIPSSACNRECRQLWPTQSARTDHSKPSFSYRPPFRLYENLPVGHRAESPASQPCSVTATLLITCLAPPFSAARTAARRSAQVSTSPSRVAAPKSTLTSTSTGDT